MLKKTTPIVVMAMLMAFAGCYYSPFDSPIDEWKEAPPPPCDCNGGNYNVHLNSNFSEPTFQHGCPSYFETLTVTGNLNSVAHFSVNCDCSVTLEHTHMNVVGTAIGNMSGDVYNFNFVKNINIQDELVNGEAILSLQHTHTNFNPQGSGTPFHGTTNVNILVNENGDVSVTNVNITDVGCN